MAPLAVEVAITASASWPTSRGALLRWQVPWGGKTFGYLVSCKKEVKTYHTRTRTDHLGVLAGLTPHYQRLPDRAPQLLLMVQDGLTY